MTYRKESAPAAENGRGAGQTTGGGLSPDCGVRVDLAQAERFLTLLDEGAEGWHFRTFPEGGGGGRNYAGDLSRVVDDLRLDNGNHRGVYVVVNAGGQTADAITRVRAVFADFDPPKTAAMPEQFPLEPHVIVESSPGKHHVYWLVDGLALSEFKATQQAIVAMLGSDPAICDLPRVMRLPGFIHAKGVPFQTRIIHESGTLPYTADAIREAFPVALVPERVSAAPGPAAGAGDRVVDVGRHDDLLKLAARLARQVHFDGMAEASAWAALQAEAERGRWTRDMPPDEMRRAFDSALAKCRSGEWRTAEKEERPSELRPVPLADVMQADGGPWPHVMDNYLPRRVVTLWGGHGGVGKSMLALTFAAHVAAGRPWGPFAVEHAAVVFLSFEDEGEILRRRLRRIVEVYGLPIEEVIANLAIFDGSDAETELAIESDNGRFIDFTPMMGLVAEAAAGAGLVIIDNASDTYGANENARALVRKFIQRLAEMAKSNDSAVVLLAHIDKVAARGGGKGNNFSGSTQWHNSVRSRLALVESEESGVELLHEKANYGARAEPVALKRGAFGVMEPIAPEVAAADRASAEAIRAKADSEAVLSVLRTAIESDLTITTAAAGPHTSWHALGRLPELPETYRSREGRKRLEAALVALERAGEIHREVYKKPNRHDGERWALAQNEQRRAA